MKTTMLTKAMMAVLFAMTSVLTLNAAKPVKITNEEVENGRVSAKVVYEQEGTFLTPEYRFEFRYNDKGQIIEKKRDRKSTRLNSSHIQKSRMPSSA